MSEHDLVIQYQTLGVQVATLILGLLIAAIGIWKFRESYNQRTNEIQQQTKVFEHQTRVDSAKLNLEIESMLADQTNNTFMERVGKYLDSPDVEFDVGKIGTVNRNQLLDYLSILEVICQFHEDEVLTTTQVYELLGYTIIDIMKVNSILEFIQEERKVVPDYMDNLQKTYGAMIDHQKKKFEKSQIENIVDFVKKKSNLESEEKSTRNDNDQSKF